MNKNFKLEFYQTWSGEVPALDYIRAQIKEHRTKIGRALRLLEEVGHEARRPQVEYLENKIYELRIAIAHHQHRVLYFFHGRTIIVIVSALLKNEGNVPQTELERARERRADWLRRFGGKT